jgi:hypothetical protein
MRQVLSWVFARSPGERSFAGARLASFWDWGLLFPGTGLLRSLRPATVRHFLAWGQLPDGCRAAAGGSGSCSASGSGGRCRRGGRVPVPSQRESSTVRVRETVSSVIALQARATGIKVAPAGADADG